MLWSKVFIRANCNTAVETFLERTRDHIVSTTAVYSRVSLYEKKF